MLGRGRNLRGQFSSRSICGVGCCSRWRCLDRAEALPAWGGNSRSSLSRRERRTSNVVCVRYLANASITANSSALVWTQAATLRLGSRHKKLIGSSRLTPRSPTWITCMGSEQSSASRLRAATRSGIRSSCCHDESVSSQNDSDDITRLPELRVPGSSQDRRSFA